jgi:hypothetical protein
MAVAPQASHFYGAKISFIAAIRSCIINLFFSIDSVLTGHSPVCIKATI